MQLAAFLLLSLSFGGCADRPGPSPRPAILVLAASDLQEAFREMEQRYEERTGHEVTVVFGSTGNLAAQIENGAPADLFFAANESFLDRLIGTGDVDAGSRVEYAVGRIAVVWRPGFPPPADLTELARSDVTAIAIANPEHAPYGMAAREALREVGIWAEVEARLVFGENIGQAHQLVRTGNADVGIVAVGLLLGANPQPHVLISDSLHRPLRQVAGILRSSTDPAAARRFLEFVTGAEGREILRRYGMLP